MNKSILARLREQEIELNHLCIKNRDLGSELGGQFKIRFEKNIQTSRKLYCNNFGNYIGYIFFIHNEYWNTYKSPRREIWRI